MIKSFISILGTNDYLECRHSFNNLTSDLPVKYVQEDSIKFFCKDFSKQDEIRIFLTNLARQRNWENDGFNKPNEGLKSRLNKSGLVCKLNDYSIPDGNSEKEIWEIFEIILNTFHQDEIVIVDITHSFRFLPMLLTTLLNFAKYQKNISVKGIYYAAFESLGPINEVKKKPIEQRVAPIFDLTSLSLLQDWTFASFDFINNANIQKLKQLVKNENKLSDSLPDNQKFLSQRVISKLEELINNVALCRGKELMNFSYYELKENILKLKTIQGLPKPFFFLIDELHRKIQDFNNNLSDLIIVIADWCLRHNYYQQMVTLLQEFSITLVLNECSLDKFDDKFRTIASQSFKISAQNISEESWHSPAKENKEITKKILNSNILKSLKDSFQSLTELRNDINHAGFLSTARNITSIKSKLENNLINYKKLFSEFYKS
jgi:CRISPR-associated Csx2 family protein